MDNPPSPTVEHRELYSMLYGSPDGRGIWVRMDTCICMTESLYYPLETITILLFGYVYALNRVRLYNSMSLSLSSCSP